MLRRYSAISLRKSRRDRERAWPEDLAPRSRSDVLEYMGSLSQMKFPYASCLCGFLIQIKSRNDLSAVRPPFARKLLLPGARLKAVSPWNVRRLKPIAGWPVLSE